MEQTESGVRVIAHGPDGSEVNITEGVMALYDLVISSMDWGSGFWTAEDAAPVAFVARTCGFPSVGEVDRYLLARKHDEEERAFFRTIPEVMGSSYAQRQAAHPAEHVWSSAGRCVWPGCFAEDQ